MEKEEKYLSMLSYYQESHGLTDNDTLLVIGPVSFSVDGVRKQLQQDSKVGIYLRENLEDLLKEEQVPIVIEKEAKRR